MKVFIATIGDESWNRDAADFFRSLAAKDRLQKHILTDDPQLADVILFIDLSQHPLDWNLKGLQRHPLAKKHPHKVMVYDERDMPHCIFPGVFVSMPAPDFDAQRQRAFSYCQLANNLMRPSTTEADLLFSFLGGRTHPVRTELLELKHPRAVVEDTTSINFFDYSDESNTEEHKRKIRERKEVFQEIVARSKFVLCPRGWGTSSFRLYETLAAGRVPVIISDDWVPSPADDWNACSVRVAQKDVASIPTLLEEREADWPDMARAARTTFEEWVAPDVLFSRLGDECQWLLENGALGRRPLRLQLRDDTFRRYEARHVRHSLRQLVAKIKRREFTNS